MTRLTKHQRITIERKLRANMIDRYPDFESNKVLVKLEKEADELAEKINAIKEPLYKAQREAYDKQQAAIADFMFKLDFIDSKEVLEQVEDFLKTLSK